MKPGKFKKQEILVKFSTVSYKKILCVVQNWFADTYISYKIKILPFTYKHLKLLSFFPDIRFKDTSLWLGGKQRRIYESVI